MSVTSPRKRTAPIASAQGKEHAAGVLQASLHPALPARATSDLLHQPRFLLGASSCDLLGASCSHSPSTAPRPDLRFPPFPLT